MSSVNASGSELRLEALQRGSKISRSPFFNFVRFNRLRQNYPSMKIAISECARQWRSMNSDQKLPFRLEAGGVPRNATLPDYFILREHALGKRFRTQFSCLKSHLERYLDASVDSILEKRSISIKKRENETSEQWSGPQKSGPVKRTPGRLPRVPFTPAQLSALEDAYKVSTYLSSEEANQLAYSLDLTNTRVKIWFQNRRARDRREKREATLGATGTTPPLGAGALPNSAAALAPVGHFAYFRPSATVKTEDRFIRPLQTGSPTGSSGSDRRSPT